LNILSHSPEQSAPLPPSMAISHSVSNPTMSHHSDSNLKLETMPPWNKEVKTPVRWFANFSQLLRNSTNIFKKLGRVVLGRLTKIAEGQCVP